MKNYQNEDEIKKSIINEIKDYMKGCQKTELICFFFEEDENIADEKREEYDNLVEMVDEDMWSADFDYYARSTNRALPLKMWVDEDGKLLINCALIWFGGGGISGDEERVFDERDLIYHDTLFSLEQLFKNIQNPVFHRLNKMLSIN